MSNECVLLVDDEKDFIDVLSERMESRGLQVFTAFNGNDAIDFVGTRRFDCVILDMMMPGLSGIDTLKTMLEVDQNLQVIVLTGHADVPNAIKALKLGALDFLEKPADLDELVRVINEARTKRAVIESSTAMLLRNMKLSWAEFERIDFNQIDDETGRSFLRELRSVPSSLTTDVYVCSDARNQAVRQILLHIPYVNVVNCAGNVVYDPRERACVVVAHGNSSRQGCGAVDYARSQLTAQSGPLYPEISRLNSDAIENAREQLAKVPEEWRAGVIFFNHETGEASLVDGNYRRMTHCIELFEELKQCLRNRYTSAELESMAKGQDPQIIYLSSIPTRLSAFRLFRISLQRGNYSGIIDDSLRYAMDHSLRGSGSFESTRVAVLAFERNEPIPVEIQELLETRAYVKEYVKRGGKVYLITVGDMPSSNTLYRVSD